MSKCLIGFCHLMSIFFLLYCCACVIESVHQFTCKTFFHSTFATETSIVDHPTDAQSQTAFWSDFNRYLIVSTADTASANFQNRHNIIKSLFENFERFFVELAVADIESAINDRFSDALLAIQHNLINETCYYLGTVYWIREYVTSLYSTFSRHTSILLKNCLLIT